MANTIELYDIDKSKRVFYSMPIFFMAILLHQSNVVFGINISFADFFCIAIFLFLLLHNQLLIPAAPFVYFLVVSVLVLVTAVYYVPIKFMQTPDPVRIMSDYIKLLSIFVYFVIGYNISNLYFLERTLLWYSVFGILIGALGIFITLFNVQAFSEILLFGNTRYRGLMIDPNYFSVLQITALVYLSRMKTIKPLIKNAAILITLVSVLTSGSKTGVITLGCYFVYRTVEYLFIKKKNIFVFIFQLFSLALIILIAPLTFDIFITLSKDIASAVPSFARIQSMLSDFQYAISGNGSGREETWKAAIQVIQLSPLTGIGIGTYTDLAREMFHFDNVAHNTYLQLSAEWGVPLAFTFFTYVFLTLGKATYSSLENSEVNHILRDIILILLIGSMAISLNNARVLWLFLGALVFSLKEKGKYDPKNL